MLAKMLSSRYEKVNDPAKVGSGVPRGSGMKAEICDTHGQHKVRKTRMRARQVLPSSALIEGARRRKSFDFALRFRAFHGEALVVKEAQHSTVQACSKEAQHSTAQYSAST